MLKVPCGISGSVRIVKENSETGEITQDVEFSNIWTDAGLSHLSGFATKQATWPNRIIYGQGVHTGGYSTVTALKSYLGFSLCDFASNRGVSWDSSICTVTATSYIVVPARGVDWNLSELGVGYDSNTTLTYTPTKNMSGDIEVIPVSSIEIVTIYYTLQTQYPMSLPAQQVDVTGLPPMTASFQLRPTATSCLNSMSQSSNIPLVQISGYLSGGASGIQSDSSTSTARRWSTGIMNRHNTQEFGALGTAVMGHIWTLSTPIAKNNTQVLDLEIFWQFSNATPIEVP